MPSYEHLCLKCNHEWEDVYSICASPPEACPNCNEHSVKRLISGGSGKGIVELSGQELVDQTKAEAQQLKRDLHKSENAYANFIGDHRYQGLQTSMDKAKR